MKYLMALLALTNVSLAKDFAQWEATSEDVRKWFQELMQPDNPSLSCCGEADAYHADSFEAAKTGEYIAIITDERPLCDALKGIIPPQCVQGRPHIPIGTKVLVPNTKLKYDRGNPTGHGVIFITIDQSEEASTPYRVLCYVVPGGI